MTDSNGMKTCMLFRNFLGAVIGFVLSVSTAHAADKPNVVFILADDLGYGDLSHAGGRAGTPHCDRLAKQGMRFTDSHTTSSVCTPTRYGIVTGRYNWRSTLKSGVLWGLSEPLIAADRLTTPKFLQKNGYHTGVIGKWHLGLGWQMLPNGEKRQAVTGPTKGDGWQIDYGKKVTGGPLAIGFDESFIIPASLDMFPYVYLKNDKPTAWATVTKAFHRPGPCAENFEAINCLRDFAREAGTFIDARAKDRKKPFFLYLPLTSPHTPIVPAKRWQGKSDIGKYGDFLMETDWVVGQVLEALDRNKLAKDTIVIFTADNGCSPAAKIPNLIKQGHKPNGDWRGHKADIFEGGHRTPFLVRWPDKVEAGSTSDQTICTTDLFATIADVLGVFLPARTAWPSAGQAAAVHHSSLDQRFVRHPPRQMETRPLPRLRRMECSQASSGKKEHEVGHHTVVRFGKRPGRIDQPASPTPETCTEPCYHPGQGDQKRPHHSRANPTQRRPPQHLQPKAACCLPRTRPIVCGVFCRDSRRRLWPAAGCQQEVNR